MPSYIGRKKNSFWDDEYFHTKTTGLVLFIDIHKTLKKIRTKVLLMMTRREAISLSTFIKRERERERERERDCTIS